ncbi:Hypothetical protein, putative, partial [Bodo saltans]
ALPATSSSDHQATPAALLPLGGGAVLQHQGATLRPPLEQHAGGRSRRMSNTAISWLEPRKELIAAVRTALSSMIFASAEDVLQMSTAASAVGSVSTPSPKANASGVLKFTPSSQPGDLSLRVPESESALGGSSSLLPTSLAMSGGALLSSATPRNGKSPFLGMFTPRSSIVQPPIATVSVASCDTQTDPVEIRPAFSLFNGTFDQKVTTKLPPTANLLRAIQTQPPHEDVGVQVELLMDPVASDSSSDDDDIEPLKEVPGPKTSAENGGLNTDFISALLKPKVKSTSPPSRSPRVAPWADSPPPACLPPSAVLISAEPVAAASTVATIDANDAARDKKSKRHSKSSRHSAVAEARPVCLDGASPAHGSCGIRQQQRRRRH